jgi:hypothetical protein
MSRYDYETMRWTEPITVTIDVSLTRQLMVLLFNLAPRPGLVPLDEELDDDNLRAMFGVTVFPEVFLELGRRCHAPSGWLPDDPPTVLDPVGITDEVTAELAKGEEGYLVDEDGDPLAWYDSSLVEEERGELP